MVASVQTLQQPFLSLAVAVSSTHPRRRLSAIFLLSLSLAVDFLSPVQGSSVDPQIPSFARGRRMRQMMMNKTDAVLSESKVEEQNATLSESKVEEQQWPLMKETEDKNAPLLDKTEGNTASLLNGTVEQNMPLLNKTEDENAELSEKKIEEQQWPVMKEIEQKNATLLNEAEEKNASLSVNKFEVQDTTLMNKTEGKNAPLLNETEENNVHFLWLFCIFWRKKKTKKKPKPNRKKPKKIWAEPNRTEISVWFRFWQKTEPIRTEPSPTARHANKWCAVLFVMESLQQFFTFSKTYSMI
ncbi:uncharacterized protein LOC126610326 isoform X2 [Malus sylvestris]|uniref:uncharacterized protein LOC126610326 isoform X2 n=1 Tax=Malus sylvestris TaxID=3752 RepID=UPI0010A9FBB1|nr:uncharacterized protein LOC114820076 [Malus domestica]XP_050134338.1 uncharacterized protein LOC126610326 isoform X2 [Malus sylvestris]